MSAGEDGWPFMERIARDRTPVHHEAEICPGAVTGCSENFRVLERWFKALQRPNGRAMCQQSSALLQTPAAVKR